MGKPKCVGKKKKQLECVDVSEAPEKPKSVMEEVVETVKEATVTIPASRKPKEPRQREEDE